jgi:serine/threonine protein phosphatase PrpC
LTRCIKGAGLRDDVPFVSHELINDDAVILCTDGLYSVAESDMASSSVDEIKARIVSPEDDATLIKISSL